MTTLKSARAALLSCAAARPYMRLSTAEIAALADAPGADLAGLLAELGHRDRSKARRVRDLIAARLVQPEPVAVERIDCVHGEVVPEQREIVVAITRQVAEPVAKPARKASPRKRKGPETLAALQARHAAMLEPGYWAGLAAQVAARRRELGALLSPWTMDGARRARAGECIDRMRLKGKHATRAVTGSHGEAGSVDCGPEQFRRRVALLRAIYNTALVGA